MKIATLSDSDLVFKFVKNFYTTISLVDLVEEEKIKQIIHNFLSSSPNERIVLLNGTEGMLAGFVQPFLFGSAPIATEIAWWVEPEARMKSVGKELVEAFEFWAKKLNCKYVTMACYADNDIGKFYEKIGYKLHEKTYFKEI